MRVKAVASFLRFIASGALNTAVTYAIYVVFLRWISYQASYTIAYATGILLSYVLNRTFVFKAHKGLRTVLLFPFVYIVQYGLSMLLLWIWIERLELSPTIAPLFVVVVTVPVTFVLTRIAFLGGAKFRGQ